jgi:protein-S-isoprenylcysteine O-methyltransferase Ste14
MALDKELQAQGNWLFRRRGYLPLLFVVLISLAFFQFDWPYHSFAVHEVWEYFCLGVSIFGLLIRVVTVGSTPSGTSGRNTKFQVAEELNTTGMYSVVRHPLYLGNFLIGLGIVSVLLVWWLPVIYTLAFWIYYERIMYAEEHFLRQEFGTEFDEWAARTPAFWPRWSQWRWAPLAFSIRNVLRREYTGLLVIVLGHTGVEFVEGPLMQHRLVWEPFWIAFSLGGCAVYVMLRMLKKRTTLLDVPGR